MHRHQLVPLKVIAVAEGGGFGSQSDKHYDLGRISIKIETQVFAAFFSMPYRGSIGNSIVVNERCWTGHSSTELEIPGV